MVEKIKQHLQDDKQVLANMGNEDKSDDKLKQYIIANAKQYLDNVNGGIEDEVVFGWARHFYIESEEVISKEMKDYYIKPTKATKPTKKTTTEENKSNQLSLFEL